MATPFAPLPLTEQKAITEDVDKTDKLGSGKGVLERAAVACELERGRTAERCDGGDVVEK